MKRDIITIIDFGGQYAHLISNRIRRLGVYTNIVLNNVQPYDLKNSRGIIFSGGPQSVNQTTSPSINPKIFELKIPILGICYGHQLFAYQFGGEIGLSPEYGHCDLEIINKDTIFEECNDNEIVWQNHGDAVTSVPKDFIAIAKTKDNDVSSMQHISKPWFSVQFHPEVTHSGELGKKILSNFVFNICKAKKSWAMEDYLQDLKIEIKEFVKDRNIFLLVSGGVDSTVCFALLNEILGKDRVFGLHIDGGFMRKDESKNVKKILDQKGFTNLEIYNAEKDFLDALKDVYQPEEKRQIIGNMYLKIKDKALEKYNLETDKWLLAQGTIYPDTIESGDTKNSDTIKTHHNRVDQIQKLIKQGLIIEPLKELYKDEVRSLGRLLGLPSSLVDRHPFPGPALAIRALCNEKAILPNPEIFTECRLEYNLYTLPIKSVGIKGDARSFEHPAILEMEYNFEAMQKIMTEITNKSSDINRVVYVVNKKDLLINGGFKKQYITKKYLEILRIADDIVMKKIEQHKLMDKIWQCPTVIIPFGNKNTPYSIIIRPVNSIDAMSASAFDLGEQLLLEITNEIYEHIPEIFAVFYDLTSKPPGTIEWE